MAIGVGGAAWNDAGVDAVGSDEGDVNEGRVGSDEGDVNEGRVGSDEGDVNEGRVGSDEGDANQGRVVSAEGDANQGRVGSDDRDANEGSDDGHADQGCVGPAGVDGIVGSPSGDGRGLGPVGLDFGGTVLSSDDRGVGRGDGSTPDVNIYTRALEGAVHHAREWLAALNERPVGPRVTADELLAVFGGPLPAEGRDPADVVDELATGAEPGLMAMGSGRFFGWVIGGTLPAGLAADWLVSAWDQNAGMRYATPATAALEQAAGQWLLELLGLPAGADVGFVTGATMANFTGLAAARYAVLARAGWDVHRDGLTGAPKVTVLVGAERHDTVDLALRYLGLGRPTAVPVDEQGAIRLDALAEALAAVPAGEPVVLCLQAGHIHSGAFDPIDEAIALAHQHDAWVHIDGAFGLWAAACPELRHLVDGMDRADSWATDAHKTLNVPYDCGIAIVADPVAMRAAFGVHASYLMADDTGPGDPFEKVPELSRRARGVPVWAVLRSLGRDGVAELIGRLVARAKQLGAGIAEIDGAEVLNEIVYTQVCVAFGDDEHTRAVTANLIADGTAWMSGSRWHGRDVLRISVSNFSTDEQDVRRSVDALRRAVDAAR